MNNKILVVDDDPVILKIFERSIAKAGHMPISFGNSNTALTWALNNDFSLAIFDYKMPKPNGRELTIKFKKNSNLVKIPIIIVTGYREIELQDQLIKLGADTVLLKPFSPSLLSNNINELIEKNKTQAESKTTCPSKH